MQADAGKINNLLANDFFSSIHHGTVEFSDEFNGIYEASKLTKVDSEYESRYRNLHAESVDRKLALFNKQCK